MTDTIDSLIQHFVAKVTHDQRERLAAYNLTCEANWENAETREVGRGRLYRKIVIGNSVRYFIRVSDGMIFASAGRSAPNLKRSFGTLATMDDFDWGEYEGRPKEGTKWTMVQTSGPYYTAVPWRDGNSTN